MSEVPALLSFRTSNHFLTLLFSTFFPSCSAISFPTAQHFLSLICIQDLPSLNFQCTVFCSNVEPCFLPSYFRPQAFICCTYIIYTYIIFPLGVLFPEHSLLTFWTLSLQLAAWNLQYQAKSIVQGCKATNGIDILFSLQYSLPVLILTHSPVLFSTPIHITHYTLHNLPPSHVLSCTPFLLCTEPFFLIKY